MKHLFTLLVLSIGMNNLYCQNIAKTRLDKNSGLDAESYTSFTFDGAWCWFSDPRAVYYEGQHKRTYAGWIDRYGDVHIGYYDHETGRKDSKVIFDGLQVDDHDNPSILFDEEGRILVFYSKHGGPNPLILSRSLEPENIESWQKPQFLALNDTIRYRGMANTYTYTQPIRLSAEGRRIYLFWRGVDNKPNYAFSDDNAETWSKGGIFILPDRIYPMRRPYLKVSSNGVDRIHFAFTDGHPRNESENSIYYMYYEKGGIFKADGEKIGNLGDEISPRMADCVYDAIPSGEKSWIWDVAENEEGKPVIVYAKFPDDSKHIYAYAKWDGTGWKTTDLVNSSTWFPKTKPGENEREPNYSGGIILDHENPDEVYLSVKRDSVFEIEKWTLQKNGRSWTVSNVTRGSSKDNVRPFTVRGASGENPLQLLWMCNTNYTHFTDYQVSIQMDLPLSEISDETDPESILDVMHRVADWQIMNPRGNENLKITNRHGPEQLDWPYGTFYAGIWALYKATGEDRYKNEIKNLGQKHSWKLINDIYRADRLTIAQSFADLYMEEKDPDMLEKIQWVMDMYVDRRSPADVRYTNNPVRHEWWTWCDALFMAPPTFARIYTATGDMKYLGYLDEYWWKTSDYLYSKEDSLFFRDDRYFDQLTENGKKIFWARGNGWVIAGLARILQHMPDDYKNRDKFIQQYKEMAAKLGFIQHPDGLWRVSLDDPEYLDQGESSCSAFFTFALAWGINNGLLDEKIYKPAVIKAWKALVNNVNNQGRLGYVQQVADSPLPFYNDQSHLYASGAFLLAGSEILKMIKISQANEQ